MVDLELNIIPYNESYIPYKVKWLNDTNINKYLHYNLPIEEEDELNWFNRIINDTTRNDYVIEVIEDGIAYPVGLIGLIHIDTNNKKAEFYISIGEHRYHKKGIAYRASIKLIDLFMDY